ncbi:DUF1836 domain-containing protein [Clostridium bornimense]|uniref:DUF1836 domain-containing protein n=1 Tax=Clostridium bornimense TaxID=1216932 RepID=UPI001C1174D8|nr:DUF1836 domain-containing protein [Clostridium bornimense]MBU5316225.1 DUF1836 domain-containing protein [Clostridium bornimense]
MIADYDDNITKILEFHCPRYNEIPNIPLYKDQVIKFVESVFDVFDDSEEKILTATMINSYVKKKIILPPIDKKYDREHIAYLIVICTMKQIFTLEEIHRLFEMQKDICSLEISYDYFCRELEESLKSVFTTRDFSAASSAKVKSNESEILRSMIMSFSHKIFVQYMLKEEIES